MVEEMYRSTMDRKITGLSGGIALNGLVLIAAILDSSLLCLDVLALERPS